jgi:hypothetical protein
MPRLENDDMKDNVKRLLKDLPKIDAPSNFETELLRRINAGEQKEEKKSWFDKILSPKLIPSVALAATAVIIFLLLRPQIDETGKNPKLSPQIYEEKFDKQFESKSETKKEKISTSDIQKTDRKSFEGTSGNQIKDNAYPEEVSTQNKISNEDQPAVLDKIETETSTERSQQKPITVGGQESKMLQIKEEKLKPIEMLKGKIDTTKDSSKNSRKLKKF